MEETIETNIITLKDEVVPAITKHPSLSHEDMVAAINDGKTFEGFLGGVEVTKLQSKKVFEVTEDDEGVKQDVLFTDKFPSYESLDGKHVCIRICNPASKTAWYASTPDIFSSFVKAFVVTSFKTKSDFEGIIVGIKYRLPVEDEE